MIYNVRLLESGAGGVHNSGFTYSKSKCDMGNLLYIPVKKKENENIS